MQTSNIKKGNSFSRPGDQAQGLPEDSKREAITSTRRSTRADLLHQLQSPQFRQKVAEEGRRSGPLTPATPAAGGRQPSGNATTGSTP